MSWRCLRFRASFTPGGPARPAFLRHREACAACAAYAALLEGAAAPREPLPAALRARLRAIRQDDVPLPLPECRDAPWGVSGAASSSPPRRRPTGRLNGPAPEPLPEPLRRRLQGIARQVPARPPLWIVQARYAVAASTLLVTLAGAAFGNPLDHGRRFTRRVGDQVSGAVGEPLARLERAEDQGRERLADFRAQVVAPWSAAAADGLSRALAAVAAAPARAGAWLDRIPSRFDLSSPDSRDDHETRPDGELDPVRETSPGETDEP